MCTTIYVGKKVSFDGSTINARTCDYAKNLNLLSTIKCNENTTNKNGIKIESLLTGTEYNLGTDTYKYLSTPTIPCKIGNLSTIGTNEHGLGVSATTTAYCTQEIKKLDPLVESGISEDILAALLASTCKTSRECVDKIAELMEKYGNNEENSIVASDQKESWYIELLTGHQWAAIKLPDDKVAAFGNQFNIQTEYADCDEDSFLHSDELFSLPQSAGLDINIDGNMSICDTYTGKKIPDYSNLRTWIAHKLLGDEKATEYIENQRFDMFFKPKDKVKLQDVFKVFRNRYENTEFDENSSDFDERRVIGTEAAFSVHAIQVFDHLPKEMCIVPWVCLSSCEHSVFLPYSNLQDKTHKAYEYFNAYNYFMGKETPVCDTKRLMVYSDDIAAICFKRLCYLAEIDRKIYGKNVRKHWECLEDKLIDSFPKVLNQACKYFTEDKNKAIDYMNLQIIDIQSDALADAKALFDELLWYEMGHTITLKYTFDFDALELDPHRLKVETFEPSFFFKDKYRE